MIATNWLRRELGYLEWEMVSQDIYEIGRATSRYIYYYLALNLVEQRHTDYLSVLYA